MSKKSGAEHWTNDPEALEERLERVKAQRQLLKDFGVGEGEHEVSTEDSTKEPWDDFLGADGDIPEESAEQVTERDSFSAAAEAAMNLAAEAQSAPPAEKKTTPQEPVEMRDIPEETIPVLWAYISLHKKKFGDGPIPGASKNFTYKFLRGRILMPAARFGRWSKKQSEAWERAISEIKQKCSPQEIQDAIAKAKKRQAEYAARQEKRAGSQ